MKGNDSWVDSQPSWLNSTLVLSSASVWISKDRSVPIHSGGPARQCQTTRSPGDPSLTSKSKVIGASGNDTFMVEPIPLGPSVWLLHHPFTPWEVARPSYRTMGSPSTGTRSRIVAIGRSFRYFIKCLLKYHS